ncbi:MAG: hypothetical protein MUO37_05020 [Methyloceanibacter sp.]|nr:hypothetical protein [Methyloceanibacter sp.]
MNPNPLAVYRTIWDARGIRQINERLSEGWELIMVEFCEEVLARSPTSRLPTSTAYQPYAIIGKRDPLVQTDRAALADASDRAASEAAIPITAEPPAAADDTENVPAGVPPQGETSPEPMGAKKEAHRTATADRDGFEPLGGAKSRR